MDSVLLACAWPRNDGDWFWPTGKLYTAVTTTLTLVCVAAAVVRRPEPIAKSHRAGTKLARAGGRRS